jgi:hypothetical protein
MTLHAQDGAGRGGSHLPRGRSSPAHLTHARRHALPPWGSLSAISCVRTGTLSPAGRLPRSLAIAPFRHGEAEVAFVPAREGTEPRESEQIRNIGGAAFVAFEIAFGKLGTHFVHE